MRRWFLASSLAASIAGFALSPAVAEDAPACAEFAWPLTRERSLFAAPDLPSIVSGAHVAATGGFAVKLRPRAEVTFALPPERAPKTPGPFAAAVEVAAPARAGVYQVTLSDEAWIDVVQAGARVKSARFTGKRDCPGLRKSVRFELVPAPFTLQISGAQSDVIDVAIEPAEPAP